MKAFYGTKQKTLKVVEVVDEAGKVEKAGMVERVERVEEHKESPYNWLPSIEKGEQIIGGAKLEEGKITPPKKEMKK